jgi:hypothetical protein
LATLGALLGCSSTQVVTPPHAGPQEASSGIVENRGFWGSTLSKGIVAVAEAKRGDLVWRVGRGRSRVELCHPGGCVEPDPAPGTELPRKNLFFLEAEEVRPSSPRAGVWLAGGRFLPYIHYCWVEGPRALCAPAQVDGVPVIALGTVATHALRRGSDVEDVLWTSTGGSLTRCHRLKQHPMCQTVFPQ